MFEKFWPEPEFTYGLPPVTPLDIFDDKVFVV